MNLCNRKYVTQRQLPRKYSKHNTEGRHIQPEALAERQGNRKQSRSQRDEHKYSPSARGLCKRKYANHRMDWKQGWMDGLGFWKDGMEAETIRPEAVVPLRGRKHAITIWPEAVATLRGRKYVMTVRPEVVGNLRSRKHTVSKGPMHDWYKAT